MGALAALAVLAGAMALSACGATAGTGPAASGLASSSSGTLAPSTYFNPVPTCSVLHDAELQALMGGTQPTSARPAMADQGELKTCTWTAGAEAYSSVRLSLEFQVPAIECSQTEPGAGVTAMPEVGNIAYYQNGLLTSWDHGLEVLLQVVSPVPSDQLPALMSADVNDVFARMGAV